MADSDLKVLIPIPDMNGFGDISQCIKLANKLVEKKIPVILTGNEKVDEKIKQIYGKLPETFLPRDHYNAHNGNFIAIDYSRNTRTFEQRKNSKFKIGISEYDRVDAENIDRATGSNVNLFTGLRPKMQWDNNLSTGLIFDDKFKEKLENPKAKGEIIDELIHSKKLSKNESKYLANAIETKWTLFYPSTVDFGPLFFDTIQQSRNRERITIFAVLPKQEAMLRYLIGNKLSYLNIGNKSLNVVNNSRLNVIELPFVTQKFFQDLISNMDLPYVITGNSSLTEAIQKAEKGGSAPLYHYASWLLNTGLAIGSLLAKESEMASMLFSTYLWHSYYTGTDKKAVNELAELFSNESKLNDYNAAFAKITTHLKNEFAANGYKDPELQLHTENVVTAIIERLMAGETIEPEE